MEAKTKDLWVFVETDESGNARNVGIELLSPGRKIADRQQGNLTAVIIGYHTQAAIDEANAHGADQILVVDREELQHFTTDAYAFVLTELVKKHGPLSLLIGATPNGRDMGPRVSCRLKTGLTADCTGLDVDEENGNVIWTRPTFGGNLMAQIQCPDHRPQMGTVRPGVFQKSEPVQPKAEIIYEDLPVPEGKIRTKVLEVVRELGDEIVDLENAEIIVAGGRGVGGKEGFAPLRELADVWCHNPQTPVWGLLHCGRRPCPCGSGRLNERSLRELAEFVKFVKFADGKINILRFKVFSYLCSSNCFEEK